MSWGFHFVDSRLFSVIGLEYCHIYILSFLVGVLVFVLFIMFFMNFSWYMNKKEMGLPWLEVFWTSFTLFVVILVGGPSLFYLYDHEQENFGDIAVKATGYQWFWHYDYDNYLVGFDSYMLPLNLLGIGEYRLLDVDLRPVVPLFKSVRFMVTSGDVIHSFFIPAVGMKMDCNSGRLNSSVVTFCFPGVYFGSCTEICGANHSFMSICLEVVSYSMFLSWVLLQKLLMVM